MPEAAQLSVQTFERWTVALTDGERLRLRATIVEHLLRCRPSGKRVEAYDVRDEAAILLGSVLNWFALFRSLLLAILLVAQVCVFSDPTEAKIPWPEYPGERIGVIDSDKSGFCGSVEHVAIDDISPQPKEAIGRRHGGSFAGLDHQLVVREIGDTELMRFASRYYDQVIEHRQLLIDGLYWRSGGYRVTKADPRYEGGRAPVIGEMDRHVIGLRHAIDIRGDSLDSRAQVDITRVNEGPVDIYCGLDVLGRGFGGIFGRVGGYLGMRERSLHIPGLLFGRAARNTDSNLGLRELPVRFRFGLPYQRFGSAPEASGVPREDPSNSGQCAGDVDHPPFGRRVIALLVGVIGGCWLSALGGRCGQRGLMSATLSAAGILLLFGGVAIWLLNGFRRSWGWWL